MNNEEQQINLKGRINGANLETEIPKPNFQADLKGLQKPELGKSKKKIILGAIIGLMVVIAGAVVVLATGLWNPVWNPFQLSPDKVLAEAFENMSGLNAVHSKIIYNIDLEAEESFSGRITMESDTNLFDVSNPKSQAVIDLSVSAKGIEFFFNGEILSMDEVFYFKLGTMPIPITLGLTQFGLDASDWTSKWFKFDSKELGMSFIKKFSDQEKIEMEQEIVQLLLDYPIAKVAEKLADEKIQEQNTYHYLLTLDKENLKQFVVNLTEIMNKYYGFDDLVNMSEEDMQEISEGIDEFFEATGGIDFEIWIGKKDKLIYRVTGQKSFDLSEIDVEEMEEGEGILSLDFDMSFSKFNEPVEIIAPEDSQSIIEMLMPLIQMFMGDEIGDISGGGDIFGLGQAPIRAKDARIKSDVNQLRTHAELIWVDSQDGYKELCYYGKANINHPDFGSQLKSLSDDIIEQGSNLVCYSNKDDYCISVQLLSNQEFFCVDSTGIAKEISGINNPCTYTAKCNF